MTSYVGQPITFPKVDPISPAEDEYVLDVTCSKGTYIRTLLEDIAAAMARRAP